MHKPKPQNIVLKSINMLEKNHQFEEHHGVIHIRHVDNGYKLEHLHDHHRKNYPKIVNPLN